MARKNTFSVAVPPEQLKKQIDLWAGSEERRNIAFLKAICQEFQNKMEEYYRAGATPEARLPRLDEVCQALIEIGFTDGERTFTIAAPFDPLPTHWEELVQGAGCPETRSCLRGACM